MLAALWHVIKYEQGARLRLQAQAAWAAVGVNGGLPQRASRRSSQARQVAGPGPGPGVLHAREQLREKRPRIVTGAQAPLTKAPDLNPGAKSAIKTY